MDTYPIAAYNKEGAFGQSQPCDEPNPRPFILRRKPLTSSAKVPVLPEKEDVNYIEDVAVVKPGTRAGKANVENVAFALQAPTSNDTRHTIATTSTSVSSLSYTSAPTFAASEGRAETESTTTSDSTNGSSSFAQKAYSDARHFAGGLITHPSESTKHFSILRHSYGLVFYQGCATSLTISLFSDAPLPTNRQIWIQNKGWSGKTGMRVKAFVGSNGSWLNVTPTIPVTADQLEESDERAWQRDIKKFLKKTKYPKHILRETLVVRIPVEASDGYFQLVLCPGDKKKVLCSSPVFRILSTSTSPSSIRGASLSTLPLELGAMALTMYANNTVGKMVSPATTAAQAAVKPFMPSSTKIETATMLYSTSGVQDMVSSTIENGNLEYHASKKLTPSQAGAGDMQNGPNPPYPISFVTRGEVQDGQGDYFSIPTMTLTSISEHIYHQLRGHYFAWARIHAVKDPRPEMESWSQVVVSSVPIRAADLKKANIAQASKRIFKIHFISDEFESRAYNGKKLDVKIMGFIRPGFSSVPTANMEHYDMDMELVASLNDIVFTQALLSQASFAPDIIADDTPNRGVLERATSSFASTRMAAQRQVDKVPLHRIGLRTEIDQVRDRAIGAQGFYIVR